MATTLSADREIEGRRHRLQESAQRILTDVRHDGKFAAGACDLASGLRHIRLDCRVR